MPLTIDEHADLKTRLEVFVHEHAAASDVTKALATLHEILEHVEHVAEGRADESSAHETAGE